MTNKNITTEEMINLLKGTEYQTKEYNCTYIHDFEISNYFGDIHNIADELLHELGRFPTQDEFVALGVERAKEYFTTDVNADGYKVAYVKTRSKGKTVHLKWSEALKANVMNRLARTYNSQLVEYTTAIQIKQILNKAGESQYKVGMDLKVDLLMGVDLVVADKERDKVIYIHIIKNTKNSKKSLQGKRNKNLYAIGFGRLKCYWKRTWTDSHVAFAFDVEESDSTMIVNGNPIFKPEWLENKLNEIMDDEKLELDTCDPDGSQIADFHFWLVKNRINGYRKGLRSFWI